MAVRRRRKRLLSLPLVSVVGIAAVLMGFPTPSRPRQVSLSGTGAPVTGDAPASGSGIASQQEFADGAGGRRLPQPLPGDDQPHVASSGKAKSNPTVQRPASRA